MSNGNEEHRTWGGTASAVAGSKRSVKLSLGLVAALVVCIAMTASASASSFLSSAKEKLLAENVATQVFTTEAGTAECAKASVTAGESSGAEATQQSVTIKYEGCKTFGFVEVTISPAEYVFTAEGEVFISKSMSIKTTGCEVSVPAQSLHKVDYATKGNNLLLEPLVTGIEYTAAGSACSKTGTFSNGTYKGHSEVMIAHGTLSFMAAGGGEPQKITMTPIECFENGAKEVEFFAVKQFCEYQVKNGNALEEVTVEGVEVGLFKGCEEVLCLVKKITVGKECSEALKTKLPAGGSCFVAIEYSKKPAKAEKTKLRVETKSVNGAVARPEVSQTVK